MRKIILALGLALALSGCTLFQDLQKLGSVTVNPTAVTIAVNVFDGVEATATNYLRLPRCATDGPVACRDPNASRQIITAIRSGRVARNNLEQFLAGHQTALGSQGAYDAIQAATNTLQAILGQYAR